VYFLRSKKYTKSSKAILFYFVGLKKKDGSPFLFSIFVLYSPLKMEKLNSIVNGVLNGE